MIQGGVAPVTTLQTILEWQRDWTKRDTDDALLDIIREHFGAYGTNGGRERI